VQNSIDSLRGVGGWVGIGATRDSVCAAENRIEKNQDWNRQPHHEHPATTDRTSGASPDLRSEKLEKNVTQN
jgi:hypothetical protein